MEVMLDQRFAQLNNNMSEYRKEQEEQADKRAKHQDETTRRMETIIERNLQQQTKITSELKGEVEGMRVHVNKIMDEKVRKDQRRAEEQREKEEKAVIDATVEAICQEREKKR